MHCPECNTTKIQREEFLKENRFCPCCNGTQNISIHRFIQWRIGDVCWLNDRGNRVATVEEMNERCLSIIEECYKKLGRTKKILVKVCDYGKADPSDVTRFYIDQFHGASKKPKFSNNPMW